MLPPSFDVKQRDKISCIVREYLRVLFVLCLPVRAAVCTVGDAERAEPGAAAALPAAGHRDAGRGAAVRQRQAVQPHPQAQAGARQARGRGQDPQGAAGEWMTPLNFRVLNPRAAESEVVKMSHLAVVVDDRDAPPPEKGLSVTSVVSRQM